MVIDIFAILFGTSILAIFLIMWNSEQNKIARRTIFENWYYVYTNCSTTKDKPFQFFACCIMKVRSMHGKSIDNFSLITNRKRYNDRFQTLPKLKSFFFVNICNKPINFFFWYKIAKCSKTQPVFISNFFLLFSSLITINVSVLLHNKRKTDEDGKYP